MFLCAIFLFPISYDELDSEILSFADNYVNDYVVEGKKDTKGSVYYLILTAKDERYYLVRAERSYLFYQRYRLISPIIELDSDEKFVVEGFFYEDSVSVVDKDLVVYSIFKPTKYWIPIALCFIVILLNTVLTFIKGLNSARS